MNRRVELKVVPGAVTGVPDDEMVIGLLVARARSALLTGLDGELEPFGLTGAQFAVLKNVADGTADTAAAPLNAHRRTRLMEGDHTVPDLPQRFRQNSACTAKLDGAVRGLYGVGSASLL